MFFTILTFDFAGTILSYNVKTTSEEMRSERVAAFEGAIGLGSTVGYALSGIINELVFPLLITSTYIYVTGMSDIAIISSF